MPSDRRALSFSTIRATSSLIEKPDQFGNRALPVDAPADERLKCSPCGAPSSTSPRPFAPARSELLRLHMLGRRSHLHASRPHQDRCQRDPRGRCAAHPHRCPDCRDHNLRLCRRPFSLAALPFSYVLPASAVAPFPPLSVSCRQHFFCFRYQPVTGAGHARDDALELRLHRLCWRSSSAPCAWVSASPRFAPART